MITRACKAPANRQKLADGMRRSDWRRLRPYNSFGSHPEIRQWNQFASK
jgi:hypothetical protein